MEASRCSALELLHTEMISVGVVCVWGVEGGSHSTDGRPSSSAIVSKKGISFGVHLHIL